MPTIDLHTHTTASDGLLTPTELVDLAAERGIDVLAVTDHDTVAGYDEAAARGAERGVRVICGIELSTRHDGRGVHMLGLFLDPSDAELRRALSSFRTGRIERAKGMVDRLNELGYEIAFEEVEAFAGGDVMARPHIARAMVARGYIESVGDAFTQDLIADGGRAYVGREELLPAAAIDLVRAAGGTAVMAHPGVGHHEGQPAPVPVELIEELAKHGLAGIEVDHPDHPPVVRDRLGVVAEHLGLVATGGSDFHAPPGRLGAESTSPEALSLLEPSDM